MRISIHLLALLALPFVTSCGNDALRPEVSPSQTDFTGQEYFLGAMFGRGPAAEGTPARASFHDLSRSLSPADLQKVTEAQEQTLDRIREIDPDFFDRLESAAEARDRVHLLRLLDESSLYVALGLPAQNPEMASKQKEWVGQITALGGLAALSHDDVIDLARAAATDLQNLVKADDVEPNPTVTIVVERAYIVPPTCDIVVYLYCPVILHYSFDLPIIANGSVETDLQREQLVDHLVRIAS